MAIADTINSIKTNLSNAYDKAEEMGATIPQNKNIENLEDTIESIPSGGDLSEYFDDSIKTASGASVIYDNGFQDTLWFKSIKKIPIFNIGIDMNYAFQCFPFERVPNVDTSNAIYGRYAFAKISNNVTIPQLDFSNLQDIRNMFADSNGIKSLPTLNFTSAQDVRSCFGANNLENIEGFSFGQAVTTTTSEKNNSFTFVFSGCTKLTEQSIINVLNGLDDIASRGCRTQAIKFGDTNLAKLTSTEGQTALANATSKG